MERPRPLKLRGRRWSRPRRLLPPLTGAGGRYRGARFRAHLLEEHPPFLAARDRRSAAVTCQSLPWDFAAIRSKKRMTGTCSGRASPVRRQSPIRFFGPARSLIRTILLHVRRNRVCPIQVEVCRGFGHPSQVPQLHLGLQGRLHRLRRDRDGLGEDLVGNEASTDSSVDPRHIFSCAPAREHCGC